jgi:hypothetical protein
MIRALVTALLLLTATAAHAVPAQPVDLTMSAPTLVPNGATFTVAWTGPVAPSYTWDAGFNDGSSPGVGSVPAMTFVLQMPFSASGAAATGYVCVKAVDSTGASTPQCTGFTVPAKPVPPPVSSTVQFTVLEPSKSSGGTALTNLATIRLYYRIDTGPEQSVAFVPSGPTGGQTLAGQFVVPVANGTVTAVATAITTSGAESARSVGASKVLTGVPGGVTNFILNLRQQ